jgi:hypothetical protein
MTPRPFVGIVVLGHPEEDVNITSGRARYDSPVVLVDPDRSEIRVCGVAYLFVVDAATCRILAKLRQEPHDFSLLTARDPGVGVEKIRSYRNRGRWNTQSGVLLIWSRVALAACGGGVQRTRRDPK